MDLTAQRSTASALLLARLGEEHGIPASASLAGTGLALDDLRVPGCEVSGRQELDVVGNLVRAGATAEMGLQAGTRYHLTTYGIWGFALASSRTVRDALAVGSRFVELSFTFCALSVEEDDAEVRLLLDDRALPAPLRPFVVARDLAGLRTLARELLADALPLRRVELRLEAPADLGPFAEVFGVVPVFGGERNVGALDAAALDLPLPQADELAAAATEQSCRDLLQRRRARTGTAGLVRDLLAGRPGRLPDVGEVAAALAVSERTLRRRLADEGTGYRALADEVRETLAEELLRTGGLSVEEVARRLGYAETASFTHAFTRWKGRSPRAWVRGSQG